MSRTMPVVVMAVTVSWKSLLKSLKVHSHFYLVPYPDSFTHWS